MIFTSLYFVAILPLIALVIALSPTAKVRNLILLLLSYSLYLVYMPKGALVLLALTLLSFYCAQEMEKRVNKRRIIAVFSVITALCCLIIFKYSDFIIQNVVEILRLCSCNVTFTSLNLFLPIGISYFTFQIVAYIVDVYKGKIQAERNIVDYALFIAYYVKLMAGPLVDSETFLEQLKKKKDFSPEQCFLGIRQILWGWFLKLCVAERVVAYVDSTFGNIDMHTGTTFALAAFFYMFQIYADFAGYSLLAIGTSNCLGLDLPHNFNMPYLSLNIKEFWRGWHISLTSWFTKYIYIPLGGSRCGKIQKYLHILIVFFVSGLWHGSDWSFIVWGIVHGVALCIQSWFADLVSEKFRQKVIWKICAYVITFVFVYLSWIFFRASSIEDAYRVITKIFTDHGILFHGDGKPNQLLGIFCIGILMASEIKDKFFSRIKLLDSSNAIISTCSMVVLIVFILTCGVLDSSNNFIYFKF